MATLGAPWYDPTRPRRPDRGARHRWYDPTRPRRPDRGAWHRWYDPTRPRRPNCGARHRWYDPTRPRRPHCGARHRWYDPTRPRRPHCGARHPRCLAMFVPTRSFPEPWLDAARRLLEGRRRRGDIAARRVPCPFRLERCGHRLPARTSRPGRDRRPGPRPRPVISRGEVSLWNSPLNATDRRHPGPLGEATLRSRRIEFSPSE